MNLNRLAVLDCVDSTVRADDNSSGSNTSSTNGIDLHVFSLKPPCTNYGSEAYHSRQCFAQRSAIHSCGVNDDVVRDDVADSPGHVEQDVDGVGTKNARETNSALNLHFASVYISTT